MFDPQRHIAQTGEEAAKTIAEGGRPNGSGGPAPVYNNPTDLFGRIAAFVGMGIIIGLFTGALNGGYNHQIMASAIKGVIKGALIGAVVGVIWNIVMVGFGGVARVLDQPVLREAIKGAMFGAIGGAVLAFLYGRVKDPLPTIVAIAVLGAGIGAVLGFANLARRAASRSRRSAPAFWDKTPRG